MAMISGWLTSGRMVDAILAVVVAEALVVGAYHGWSGRGVMLREIILNLLSGACLLLALRAALDGAAWPWVPLSLIGAFGFHLADLRRRWRRPSSIASDQRADLARR